MRNKKSQITLFIILGIVVLVGVATVVYIRSTIEEGKTEPLLLRQEVRYEGEQEIRSFVDSCLKPIVLQGLEIQRLQGGYIEIPSNIDKLIAKDKEENKQIKIVDNSRTVMIDARGQGNEAPFWITKYGIVVPSKRFMEIQLENYVKKELDNFGNSCFDFGYRICGSNLFYFRKPPKDAFGFSGKQSFHIGSFGCSDRHCHIRKGL